MLLFLPELLVQRGWSSQKVGWAMGSYFSVYIVAQILAGQLANRYGNITTALIGAGLQYGQFRLSARSEMADIIFLARTLHGSGCAGDRRRCFSSRGFVPIHLKGRMLGVWTAWIVMLAGGPSLSELLKKLGGFGGTFAGVW
jgi:MFS family permease